MAGGVTLQVRQVGSYPAVGSAGAGDLLLMQPGGLGNPYATIDAQTLVETALGDGSLGVGHPVASNAAPGNIFATSLNMPGDYSLLWNAYTSTSGAAYWGNGAAAAHWFDPVAGFTFAYGTPGQAGNPVNFSNLLQLTPAGAAILPNGTLTVARDPLGSLEVATAGWVGRNTVTSFNGRQGAVTLNGCDVYSALCLNEQIATEPWVMSQIQSSITMLLANHPFVFGWNGRTGAVYLTLADISCVFFQPGQQPITQTPPLTSNDYSIPNTQWVVEYIANEFAGGGGNLATQTWVLANTVNSFNGRMGVVTLTGPDVFDVGAAPLNSPQFSGIPTAPTAAVGQATGQIATTAFVQQAISESTAGVASFNGRTGTVTLTGADITGAGGLANPSPNLTGNPTAPTQAPGTTTPTIATCEFVMAALAAGNVTSFNTRTGAVTLTLADVTGVGGAPLVSPAFSSVPTAPTAAPGTNTPQLATTAFVQAAVTAVGGVSSFNSRTGAIVLEANDVSAVGGLINPSVGLTGIPTAPTATAGTNTNQIATTAFVATALGGAVTSFNTRTGAVVLTAADITAAGGALLAGPAFTGTPTAPTAVAGTNNTQIATTAFVLAAIASGTAGVSSFNGRQGAVTLTTADVTGAGGAPIASPSFTGTPLGPTATPGTSTTQLATTAFVAAAIAASGVTSWNTRTGAVTLQANDLSAVGGALLASPTFTGTPAVPTATAGTNTTQAASTAFVTGAIAAATAPLIAQNYVDNSGFTINQRSYASGTALAAGAYGLDRWKAGSGGCTPSFTATPAATVVTISAGSLQQVVEAGSVLSANYTLSWVGTAQGRVAMTAGGGTYAASPIQFAATANTSIYIEFTGGTVSQVQLQLGTVATVWQPQPIEVELARCQRYYQQNSVVGSAYSATNGATVYCGQSFLVQMRAQPTTVTTVNNNSNLSTVTSIANGPSSMFGQATITSGGTTANFNFTYTASADL